MAEGRTLWELLTARVAQTPDALMIVDEDFETLTFAEFAEEAERAAAGLLNYGIDRTGVVSWQLPNCMESLVLAAALSRLGMTQNPLPPTYGEDEVRELLYQVDTRLLIVPAVWRERELEKMATELAHEKGDVQVLVVDGAIPQGDPSMLPPLPDLISAERQPARWLLSSAAALPRAARHSDATIGAAAAGMIERLVLTDDDRVATIAPFSHVEGLTWLSASLQCGCALVVVQRFDPADTPEVFSREQVTLAPIGRRSGDAYLEAQGDAERELFPLLRAFLCGSRPPHADLLRDASLIFGVPVLPSWSPAEAPVLTLAAPDDDPEALSTSSGRPLLGVELKICDADGRPLPPGDDGEVRTRGPQVTLGFVDPDAHETAFDEDGFLRTGELGHLDEAGNLVLLRPLEPSGTPPPER